MGTFRESKFVKNFMAQSVLEKDAQQQQHISTPNIRVDHIGNNASQANRGGGGQNKRNIAPADAVAAPPAQAARSEDGPCGRGGRAEADGEVPGGAAAGAGPTGGISADGASQGGSRGCGEGRAARSARPVMAAPLPPRGRGRGRSAAHHPRMFRARQRHPAAVPADGSFVNRKSWCPRRR